MIEPPQGNHLRKQGSQRAHLLLGAHNAEMEKKTTV